MRENANCLPPIKLISLEDKVLPLVAQKYTSKSAKIAVATDIRWMKVLEFLRSNNLAPNSRKLYQRELKRFLGWTQLHYHELRPRHFGLYK